MDKLNDFMRIIRFLDNFLVLDLFELTLKKQWNLSFPVNV